MPCGTGDVNSAHRLRNHYCREANGNSYHVAILKQTPKLQKGDTYVGSTTVLFQFISDAALLVLPKHFSLPGLPHAAAAKYLCVDITRQELQGCSAESNSGGIWELCNVWA